MSTFSNFLVASIGLVLSCGARADEKPPLAVEKLLGASRDSVRRELGESDRAGDQFDSFYKVGVVVSYDDTEIVAKVVATQFTSGGAFRGKVLGIGLGETKKDCVSAWGNPVRTEKTRLDYDKVTWHFQGYLLDLDIWNKGGDDSAFGEYEVDRVKRIVVREKPN